MNAKAALVFLAVLAAFIVLIGWVRQRATALDSANQALRYRVQDLEQQLTQNPTRVETSGSSSLAEARADKLELMRLRNEVTQLRASNQALTKLETENSRLLDENKKLRRGLPNPPEHYLSDSIPRDQWSFKGYSTPQDAMLSSFSAMRDGNVQVVLSSLTPEERERFEQQNQGKSEAEITARFQKEFGRVTGIRFLSQQQISPDEVILDVNLEGIQANKRVRINLVGNEWKAGGPVNQNTDYDPLAFYRKNPELMKRYFPHLVKESAAQEQTAADAALARRYGLQPKTE
jgi:hypothetical protein